MKKKWVVMIMNSEECDFYFQMAHYEGSLEDFRVNSAFAKEFDLSNMGYNNGVYTFGTRDRVKLDKSNKYAKQIADHLNVIQLKLVYLVPLEKLGDADYLFSHQVVSTNNNYGFLDINL